MFLELVKKRHSTRKYSHDPIPREKIMTCLEAARLAPSACNSQPWKFLIIDNKEKKTEIAKKALSGIYSMNHFALDAPVIVAVITERSRFFATLGRFFRGVRYNLIDVGISCEHFVLQAAELGIGTCWIGWFNEKAIKKTLGLPRSTHIDILISMGYPSKGATIKEKNRRPISEIHEFI